jgi:hypothetical protein
VGYPGSKRAEKETTDPRPFELRQDGRVAEPRSPHCDSSRMRMIAEFCIQIPERVSKSKAIIHGPWNPTEADLVGWDLPLPSLVLLAPDYDAPLPLWADGARVLEELLRTELLGRARVKVDLWPLR